MKKATILLFILLAVALCQGVSALTASIGNAKMYLNVNLTGEPVNVDRTIMVRNVNNVSVVVTLEALDDLEGRTTLLDNEFVLDPDEEMHARFRVTVDQPGYYEGRIAVGFQDVNPVGAGGVGLQSQITIIATGEGVPIKEGGENQTGSSQGSSSGGQQIIKGGSGKPSPVVGGLIILVIIAIGVVVYLLITSKKE
ncbi:MAG: hypothetical protein ABIC95_01965 [archaeon]